MILFHSVLFALVSLIASIVGTICGIGGGIIIKPMLDLFGWESVTTISFMSGCTVLAMSTYSVLKSLSSNEKNVNLSKGTPLAIGASVGGIIGKQMFSTIKATFENPNTIGAIQAFCLTIITIGTLIYTIRKDVIKTYDINNKVVCFLIGCVLGVISSFLGIGGGPINLVILFYFFSMPTKTAAANSLYIILFSQLSSFISTLLTKSVPAFSIITLGLMVGGGVAGGMIGRKINKKINTAVVDKLFIGLMIFIILVNIYNTIKYTII